MVYPDVRRAEPRDYKAIWAIWMQDDVSQWMSFKKEEEEPFKDRYQKLDGDSHIYVMIDLIDGEEKVVGVRRIHYGKKGGPYQHVAEFCSMGVLMGYRDRGYGKVFYEKFEKIVEKEGIKKIELTQSSNNKAARHIADRRGYTEEAVFPDWLERTKNDGAYHIYERFIYKFLDTNLEQRAKTLPSLKFDEVFPDLKTPASGLKTLFKLNMVPNETTYRHIGFLSFENPPMEYSPEAVAGVKMILRKIMQEARVKKLELFTFDPIVIEICNHVGFFVRGEKMGSACENGVYRNELSLEYSFLGIEDAKKIIHAQITNPIRRDNIDNALSRCKKSIGSLESQALCDSLGANYLENLIYQIVRDVLGENKVFSLDEERWQPLLTSVPRVLWSDINALHKELYSHSFNFFTQPTLIAEQQRSVSAPGRMKNN